MTTPKRQIDYETHDDERMIRESRKDQEQADRDYDADFRREWERHYGSNPDADHYE